jgi:hypothetical protein
MGVLSIRRRWRLKTSVLAFDVPLAQIIILFWTSLLGPYEVIDLEQALMRSPNDRLLIQE